MKLKSEQEAWALKLRYEEEEKSFLAGRYWHVHGIAPTQNSVVKKRLFETRDEAREAAKYERSRNYIGQASVVKVRVTVEEL